MHGPVSVRCRRALGLAVFAVALACGCASRYDRHYHLLAGHRGDEVERALLVPVNLVPGLRVGLVGETAEVSAEIAAYLESHGIQVARTDEGAARELWRDCLERTQGPDSHPDESEAAIAFVRRLREQQDFDVLVLPTLLYREGALRRGRVYWDGVAQDLPLVNGKKRRDPLLRVSRHVKAVSLHVIVFDERGAEIFHGTAGLDVAEEAEYIEGKGDWYLRHREDLFTEEERLRDGVALAFEPYLSRPETVAAPSVDAPAAPL